MRFSIFLLSVAAAILTALSKSSAEEITLPATPRPEDAFICPAPLGELPRVAPSKENSSCRPQKVWSWKDLWLCRSGEFTFTAEAPLSELLPVNPSVLTCHHATRHCPFYEQTILARRCSPQSDKTFSQLSRALNTSSVRLVSERCEGEALALYFRLDNSCFGESCLLTDSNVKRLFESLSRGLHDQSELFKVMLGEKLPDMPLEHAGIYCPGSGPEKEYVPVLLVPHEWEDDSLARQFVYLDEKSHSAGAHGYKRERDVATKMATAAATIGLTCEHDSDCWRIGDTCMVRGVVYDWSRANPHGCTCLHGPAVFGCVIADRQ